MSDGCVVLHSGGLDSTVLLCEAIRRFGINKTIALNVHYGQRHAIESVAHESICEHLHVRHQSFKLSDFRNLVPTSALTNDGIEVPAGEYTLESLKVTVVPGRNMVLIALANAMAAALNYDTVGCAVHAGDHAVYPDCRPGFISAMQNVLRCASFNPIALWAPFLNISKAAIVRTAGSFGLNVPYELTYSCYNGGDFHCGVCSTCVERKRAFKDAGITDPTEYVQAQVIHLPQVERDQSDGPRPYVDIGYCDPDDLPDLEDPDAKVQSDAVIDDELMKD